MSRKAEDSPKAERDRLRDRMRALGCTMPQIAAELSRKFALRPRVAWRYALGWQQWKLAQRYNTLHPGAKLSHSRISAFESWPYGGSPPTLRYLVHLADTFGHGCTAAHLVDTDDLEHLNPADRHLLTSGHPPAAHNTEASQLLMPSTVAHLNPQVHVLAAGQPANGLVVPADPAAWATTVTLQLPAELVPLLMTCLEALAGADGDALSTPGGWDRVYHRLVQYLASWAHTMKRRNAIRALGWAAAAASVGHLLDPDELVRVAAVMSNPGRVDAQTIEHIEAVLWRCEMQERALGPHAVLDTVLAQRQLIQSLLPDCSDDLRPRLLSASSGASRQAGWLSFDLNDFDSAGYYYEDARTVAHEAQDLELSAYVLCEMGHLATWRGQPRTGIDHAVAAGQWAARTGNTRLRACTADIAAQAYAAEGQRDPCLAALDAAQTALAAPGDQAPHPVLFCFYDEAIHISVRGKCHLKLGDSQRTVDYAQQSLTTLNPSNLRNIAFVNVYLGMAYIQSGEVEEATRLFGDAGEIAARNNWARLIGLVQQGRADLQPWKDSTAVRALDDRLASCGVA